LSADTFPRAPAERVARYRAAGLWDDRALADGLEAAAALRPDAVALADKDARLSYADLARAVASATAGLAARGVRPGQPVILVSGNTRHGVIAYHALLRSGATIVALDRRCGTADLLAARSAISSAVPGSHPVIIAAEEEARLDAALSGTEVIPLELFDSLYTPRGSSPGGTEPDRDCAAVVLFSSGTTGRPKGALHSINTLTAGAANMARITCAVQDTVCFLISPLTSITGLMQVHMTADTHAALVLEDQFEPGETLRRMNACGATLLGGAPVIAERLLRAAQAGSPRTPLTLRTLALGGAMLPRPLLELATDAFGIGIARVYGSTEAPNFTGSLPADSREARLSDDGALMPGSEVRVGSSAHPREGLLRGPGVFLGYLDPADNAAAFEDGWYRTGDEVELSSARLTVVGRLKEVVNRNGLKISLPEADAALEGLPGVLECSSFAIPDPETGERLAVAVQLADGASLSLDDVTACLLGRGVARRKLPEQLVRWDGPLPRTASGKIVRSRLTMESPAKDCDLAPRLSP
jgi:acyl-CoA synthetase (AMP-forming)/AMP-acid ligase II